MALSRARTSLSPHPDTNGSAREFRRRYTIQAWLVRAISPNKPGLML
jgi:hypothetical protein